MSSNIVERHGTDLQPQEIVRYTFRERLCHWLSAVTYVYLLLSGLALFTPYLYWLAYVLGGGAVIRFWHPWFGLAFFIVQLWMHSIWRNSMKTMPEDRQWSKNVEAYITNRDDQVPPVGQFNHGQKQFYWIMYYSAFVLLVTGLLMWFPESVSARAHWLMPIVVFLHSVAALVTIGAFMIHIYMGIFFVPGGLRGIMFGRVPMAWARAHHRLWFEKLQREGRSRLPGSGSRQGADD